jgi:hypothetical protein
MRPRDRAATTDAGAEALPVRPRGPRRAGAWLAAALACVSLAACGDDPAPALPVLVHVVAHRFDGEPPSRELAVRRLGSTTLEAPIPLVPVAGRPHVYEARGATAGRYVLVLPEGWGPLASSVQPYLQPDGRPTRMNVGRNYTIYCAASGVDRPLGDVWGARRVEPSGALGAALHLDVQPDGAGWVLLRFKPEEWAGPLALQGRFTDGRLTELVLTTPSEGGRPILRHLAVEPVAPLDVPVVGAETAAAPLWVLARVLGLPLDEVQQQPVREGVARFDGLATSRDGLELTLGDGPDAPRFRLATEAWARGGEVRLLAPLPGRVPVRLPMPADAQLVRVQLRPEEGSSYGWVPARVDGGGVLVDVAPGTWRALVETSKGFHESRFRVPANGEMVYLSSVVDPQSGAVVRGSVKGAGGERVVWERQEDGRGVLGHGFAVRVRSDGAFEVVLPAGAYRTVIETARGTRSAPRERTLMPGDQVSVALEAPPDPPAEGERPR